MELEKKLLKISMEINAIAKDSVNPHFKNSYFDINKLLHEIKPILITNDLLLIQPIQEGFVRSIIIDTESGESIISGIELPKGVDPQKLGSAITYFRRYTLVSLLAIEAEDDDGNASTIKPTEYTATSERHPIDEWLTQDQFNKAMEAEAPGVRATLSAYDGKSGKGMKKDYRIKLTERLSYLIEEESQRNLDPFESALP